MKLLKGYRKYLYERDTVFATAGVFIVIGLLALLPLNTGLLNPVKKAFADSASFTDADSNIIRAVSVSICFHLVEGGKPLNCCASEK